MHVLQLEIKEIVGHAVAKADTATEYREPLIGFASASDPRFRYLREAVSPRHLMPEELGVVDCAANALSVVAHSPRQYSGLQ